MCKAVSIGAGIGCGVFDVTHPSGMRAADPAGERESDGDVGRRAASGVLWLTMQKWATRLLGFVTIAVLTRLLSPEDFGTVAAASTVLPFFFLVADLGFAAYIVQVDRANRRMLSTAWWFSLVAGATLAGLLVAVAPLLGAAFRDERVVPVLQVLSLWVLLTAVGSVPMAILRRKMLFKRLAAQGAIAAVVAQVVALSMAFSGFGVWALVGQSLVAPVVTTSLAWFSARWAPTRDFSAAEFRRMLAFGAKVLGVEFIAMLRAWAEAAVVSAVLGIVSLGYLSVAQRLVQVVQDLTGGAIIPVTTVAFARLRDDPERLRKAYLRALTTSYAALSLPLTVIAVTAPMLIPIVFGPGWEASAQVAQLLALAATMTVAAALDHGLFYGLGRPGLWLIYAIIVDALTLGVTVGTVSFGLTTVAMGFVAVCVLATIVRWFLTARVLGTRLSIVCRPFGYLIVAVFLSGSGGLLITATTAAWNSFLVIVVAAAVIVIVHLGVTALMAPEVPRDVVTLVRRSSPWRRFTRRQPKES
ncbi:MULTISPECIES: lipopolysaccharide biosynthesis protein [Microbacterium]|uniref:Membrane protein involved in the export of O-antigen and teichoic acid n=1 Tax=Microbacterium saccharophilum TaxID=1213358 RepID=A0A7Z7CZQ9_9MICO|nr:MULTISPECIES: lipopolysaccharide biosynthesis protein [Microbacterium]SFI76445.1 Membrane protein involved in the export of O-antigen and teichoic acid [Microbacterium saccharophilum]